MRDAIIPLKTACEALDVPRSTVYRHLKPKPKVAPQPRPRNRRRIPDQKRAEIIALLHSDRFIDQTPRQVYGELLDEERYVASVRTFSVVRKPSSVTHGRFRDELRLITMTRDVTCGCGNRGRRGVGNRGTRGGGRGMAVGRCRARASNWYCDGVDWTSLGSAWIGHRWGRRGEV